MSSPQSPQQDALQLILNQWANGGVLPTEDMALGFAQLVLSNPKRGDYHEQLPLSVEDRGDTWFVQGSFNKELKQHGKGPFQIEFRKIDAQVLRICYLANFYSDPA